MKNLLIISVLTILTWSLKLEAANNPYLKEVELPIVNFYIPEGFDSNDNTQVVVESYLPSLCYQAHKAEVKREGKKFSVVIKGFQNIHPSTACLQMVVPYIEAVTLGPLEEGEYTLQGWQNQRVQKESALQITDSSTSEIDNHIYANVEYIKASDDGKGIILYGHNPSKCFELDRVEVIFNKNDTYALLPILRLVPGDAPCSSDEKQEFYYQIPYPENIPEKNILFHVRIMNGNSLNFLWQR